MIQIKSKFSKQNVKYSCFCGKEENMTHIYNCQLLNLNKQNIPYKSLFYGYITQQIIVFKRFDENFENC